MLENRASQYHLGISGGKERLEIRYLSTTNAEYGDSIEQIYQKLCEAFEQSKADDIRNGCTTKGAHRDDAEILINGKNARLYASQGQQRSAVLSLKLAEAAVLSERMGEKPIILLDDVMSELDSKRQDFLLNKLDDCQVFITCCEQSNKEQLRQGKIFNVSNGVIS